MLLEVKRSGQGPCVLCCEMKEGAEIAVSDGSLNGWLCYSHLKKFLVSRANHIPLKTSAAAAKPDGAER